MIGETRYHTLKNGLKIFLRISNINAPAWVIVTHGVGSHSGRHGYLKETLGRDFNVLAYDLRGHGQSEGLRADLNDFTLFYKDLGEMVEFLQTEYNMTKYGLLAHSMGSLIVAGFMQQEVKSEAYPSIVFINAPPVGVGGPLAPIVRAMPLGVARFLASIPWGIKIGGLVDLSNLSHDKQVEENYINDPCNIRKLKSTLIFNLVYAQKDVFSKPLNVKCPAFVTVGSNDEIVCRESLKNYFLNVEKTFELREFEGSFHEIHNEVDEFKIPYLKHMQDLFRKHL